MQPQGRSLAIWTLRRTFLSSAYRTRSLTLSHFRVSKFKAVELKVRLIVSLLLATRVVILALSLTVAVSVGVTLSVSLTVLCLTASFGLAVRTAGGADGGPVLH